MKKTEPIQLVLAGTGRLPALFTPTPHAAKRFVAFFTANIRNPNTRKAYAWAVSEFAGWCERHGLLSLQAIEPVHVALFGLAFLGDKLTLPLGAAIVVATLGV
ncbi:MAG: hypothetical protein ABL983_01770, partial [Nitrospira sp.]